MTFNRRLSRLPITTFSIAPVLLSAFALAIAAAEIFDPDLLAEEIRAELAIQDEQAAITFPTQFGIRYEVLSASEITGPWEAAWVAPGDGALKTFRESIHAHDRRYFQIRGVLVQPAKAGMAAPETLDAGSGFSVEVVVSDEEGFPIPGKEAVLAVSPPVSGIDGVSATADQNGRIVFEGLILPEPGQYEFAARVGELLIRFVITAVEPGPREIEAPLLSEAIATTPHQALSFLYAGAAPVQIGVDPGNIEPRRAALVRGRALDQKGEPLQGVRVSILNHPEYGHTFSRSDGWFDLAVNGGGMLVLNYEREGFLPAQRQVSVPWQEYRHAPEVVLVSLDQRATVMDLNAGHPQVHRSTRVQDEDGERTTVILAPGDTTSAVITLPDGSKQTLDRVTVRATEYTVGAMGPAAMPAELPSNVAYTYAVELSVDEALAAGATRVEFDRPVIHYVDNFLGFAAGEAVPVAYYDRETARWIPEPNGRVIAMLGVSGGLAELDITGDGAADEAAALLEIGITEAERSELAGIYESGASFWRVSMPHFSAWDCNWPFGLPEDAERPDQERPESDDPPDDPCGDDGYSVLECQSQALRSSVAVAGTGQALHYSSRHSPARGRQVEIHLSGPQLPQSLLRIELELSIAGQLQRLEFLPTPNLTYTFVWDGLDAYGRGMQGKQVLETRIGYTYPGVYGTAAATAISFGQMPSDLTANGARQEITIWQTWRIWLGTFDNRAAGLGGWRLSDHHAYDPMTRRLYLGSGRQRSAHSVSPGIQTVAGLGFGFGGDGGPASLARFNLPSDIALAPGGSLYIADTWNHRVRRVDNHGIISTIAGTGAFGFSGDGGPAASANLYEPSGLALAPDGAIYVSDSRNNRIRRIGPDGIIRTIAGTGTSGFGGDGGPAVNALLNRPAGIAIDSQGELYVADTFNHRVRRIGPDGTITTVAGTGRDRFSGDGGRAINAELSGPRSVVVAPDGALYIADSWRVRRVGVDGIISTVAGIGLPGFSGDGGPATAARIDPRRLDVAADGALYIADTANHRIRRISPDGIINTVVGTGNQAPEVFTWNHADEGAPPLLADLRQPLSVAFGQDGAIYFSEILHIVRAAGPSLHGFSGVDIAIPAEDASELYLFDSDGLHMQTIHPLTGATLREFVYDNQGRLTAMIDGHGNLTAIERGADGKPLAIIAPYGQRTELALDASGFLASVRNPAGEVVSFTYGEHGLLTRKTDARGQVWQYSYDAQGRLTRAEDPAGGFRTFERARLDRGYEVTKTTGMGRQTRYSIERLPDGSERLTNTFPDGTTTTSEVSAYGSRVVRSDGSVTTLTRGPDPLFGMLAPALRTLNITTPGGIEHNIEQTLSAVHSNSADPPTLETLNKILTINGRTYSAAYDAATMTYSSETPAGRNSTVRINELGQVAALAIAGIPQAVFAYDERGRVREVVEGSGGDARRVQIAYNSAGLPETVTGPMGRNLTFIYDEAGRPIANIRPDGSRVEATLDAAGNVTSLQPPGRPAHAFDYTPVNLLAQYAPPGSQENERNHYSYDLDRMLILAAMPGPLRAAIDYSASGEYGALQLSGGPIEFSYDSAGRVSEINARGIALSHNYDAMLLARAAWSGQIDGLVELLYSNDLALKSIKVNEQFEAVLSYDADGLLTGAGDLTINRDTQTGRINSTQLSRITDSRSYNSMGELSAYIARHDGITLFEAAFERDALGRIASVTETILGETATRTYRYDAAGRLTETGRNGALTGAYAYDSNGNRLRFTGPNGDISASYDAQDRMETYGDLTYAYTPAGQLRSRSAANQSATFTYDELGNLLSVALPDGRTVEYLIDGFSRRVGRKVDGNITSGFLYLDALRPIAELDPNGNAASFFVYGSRANSPDYMIADGAVYRLITDHIGSVRLVVNAETGEVAQRIDYDPFGRVTLDTRPGFQPFGFAGGLYDTITGLVRFGARDYDSETGRWTARDPLLFAGGDPNLYVYAWNDPVNWIDPAGRSAEEAAQKALDAAMKLPDRGRQMSGAETVDAVADILEKFLPQGLSFPGIDVPALADIFGIPISQDIPIDHPLDAFSPWSMSKRIVRETMVLWDKANAVLGDLADWFTKPCN